MFSIMPEDQLNKTKEFGVPESLLEIGHKGGVENMFYDDPALSRAAITKAL